MSVFGFTRAELWSTATEKEIEELEASLKAFGFNPDKVKATTPYIRTAMVMRWLLANGDAEEAFRELKRIIE